MEDPPVPSDRDEIKAFAKQAVCLSNIKTYHSRVKKALFLATVVRPSFINSKAVAIAMSKHLIGDILPRDRCKGKDVAVAMAELALATQDFDLIQDICILNGRPKNTSFDVLWSEIKSLFESHARVDDRRHGKNMWYLLYSLCV